jgi:polyhydroxybutyrate depolymerase
MAALILLIAATSTPAASTIQFRASSYSVVESVGFAELVVQRTGDLDTVVGVSYATADGTATNGVKYTAVSGTLTFDAGQTNASILVPILNNGLVEPQRTFKVLLSTPTGGAILGTRTTASVGIADNDNGMQFRFMAYSVAEDAGLLKVEVLRGDDGSLPVSVDISTSDQTAVHDIDYIAVSRTLSFAPQERSKSLAIQILNNTREQGGRVFRLGLSHPAGTALGSQAAISITIQDNDQGFAFDSASYITSEDAGIVEIPVRRGSDDATAAASVDVATSDLTAHNGSDYSGVTNTVTFAPGELVRLVPVPILNDGVKEATKNFRLTLSHPSGGELSSRLTTTVAIVDNDAGVGFERGAYALNENLPAAVVTVTRGNDGDLGPFTVNYTTKDLGARAGVDYTATAGTLVFRQNETLQTIHVPILRNAARVVDRVFTLSLSAPTDGRLLGVATASITLVHTPERGTVYGVAVPFDTALTIRRDGAAQVVAWKGGGQLQRADTPEGPWQTVSNATSPYRIQSPVPTAVYRVTRPRPVELYAPSTYDGHTPLPLVILLHGYGGTGAGQEDYMGFRALAESRGFLYCSPDSLADQWGNQYWNATDGCCDFGATEVDDAGYLRALITEIEDRFAVDRKRVSLAGHSNGGFMSYRMACESADLIAGIASLAGMTFLDPARCQPTQPVNILHIHGTADNVVLPGGGALLASGAVAFPANMSPHPGVLQTIQTWAAYNHAADPVTDPGPTLDLDLDVAGRETVITRYTSTQPGGAVESWSMLGGSHSPTLNNGVTVSEFARRVVDWLLAHPKP